MTNFIFYALFQLYFAVFTFCSGLFDIQKDSEDDPEWYIEYQITEFAFGLCTYVQEDMSRLVEQEHILILLQQKYHSMSEKDGCEFLNSIASRADRMPVEMVTEEFLK